MHWFSLHKQDHLILIPQTVHPFPSPKVSCSHPYHPRFLCVFPICAWWILKVTACSCYQWCRTPSNACIGSPHSPWMRVPLSSLWNSGTSPFPPPNGASLSLEKPPQKRPKEPPLSRRGDASSGYNACLPFSAWSQYRISLLFVPPIRK